MSDLISRSEVYMNDLIRRKDVLALFPTNDCSDKMVGLYERVLDIPTAYDIEKVMAELGKWSAEVQVISEVDGKIHRVKVVNAERAINIAREGGVE